MALPTSSSAMPCGTWPVTPAPRAGGTTTPTSCRPGSRRTWASKRRPSGSVLMRSSSCPACCRPRTTPAPSRCLATRAHSPRQSSGGRGNLPLPGLPFAAGGRAAAGGPFSILRFAEPDLPDFVYLEQLTSALYLDKRETVDHYLAVMERLCIEAAPATSSTRIIHAILRDL